jgi:hypothetical protein
MAYPAYDSLAEEAGSSAVLIKVDINQAHAIGQQYSIRVTPSFMTFLHGEKENEWTGASPSTLLSNVRLLLQMAQHPHKSLDLPILRSTSKNPILFTNMPPLDKLIAKLGAETGQAAPIQSLKAFITARSLEGAREATLPDMPPLVSFLHKSISILQSSSLFPLVDLLRAALVDPRFSAYLAEEPSHSTIFTLLKHVNATTPTDESSYPLRLVTLQAACNLFSTPLYPPHLVSDPALTQELINLTTSSLLDKHPKHAPVRVAASSLAFNIAVYVSTERTTPSATNHTLTEGMQVELLVSLLEAIDAEQESPSALRGLLLAIGFLVWETSKGGEVWETAVVMDGRGTVLAKKSGALGGGLRGLLDEVGEGLFGKMHPV